LGDAYENGLLVIQQRRPELAQDIVASGAVYKEPRSGRSQYNYHGCPDETLPEP
jgi:hypothetical protein